MKIAVYAICKNEARFAERWFNSMSEADCVSVLDTGSEDRTPEKLASLGAEVSVAKISPWRFDQARNLSLDMVPVDADICVCTDLDEVFHSGWRECLEKAWLPEAGRARYRYTWSFTPAGEEGVVFWQEKIHTRHGWKWIYPVHEVLKWTGEKSAGITVTAEGVQLDHYPDAEKSRAQYLPLLELAAREAPEDDRCMHYLGREYMFAGRWDEGIRTLLAHLSMPSARWRDERAASMRYIARSYLGKGERASARDWYLLSIAEAPYLREGYVELARQLYEEENWYGVLYFTDCALEISERPMSYISEPWAWGSAVHDLRSIAFFKLGKISLAADEAELAGKMSPLDARIRGNAELLRGMANEKCR